MSDFATLEAEIVAAEARAADAYDRVAAYRELRALWFEVASDRQRPDLTIEQLLASPQTEADRARMRSICRRIDNDN